MSQSVLILGRQPALGLAELESLYGADKLRPIGGNAALLNVDSKEVNLARLGGTVKVCKLLSELNTASWHDIHDFLIKAVPDHLQYLPEGKLHFGLSVYGLPVSLKHLNASGLTVKKTIKAAGRSVRLVPNTSLYLNSAQVLHNRLTGPLGWELVFVRDGTKTLCAQTVAEQDIGAYAGRDQKRPKRDPRVGMLPPKLAQIIINLAANQSEPTSILDPFCGTGVILQEALLLGCNVYGTDIEPRMIDYSKVNLEWLSTRYDLSGLTYLLETGDAIKYDWQTFDTLASETYLGRPFSAPPRSDLLEEVIHDVNVIHKKFLQNITRQTKHGFRLCIAVPAWKASAGFRHLPTLDHLEKLGYNRISFVHVHNRNLIYHREGQIVGRELVVLQRV